MGEILLDDVSEPNVITKILKGRRGKQDMSVTAGQVLVSLLALKREERGYEARNADSRESQGQILP